MDQNFESLEQSRPQKGMARYAMHAASESVQRHGVLFSMIVSLLVLLIVGFAWYVLFGTVSMVVGLFLPTPTVTQIFWSEFCLVAGFGIAFLLLVMPFFMGRLRMAGLCAAGERPDPREMLYYFTSRRRYTRALSMSIELLLGIALPCGISYGAVCALAAFWNRFLRIELDEDVAFLILLSLIPVALFLCLITFFLCGSYLPATAVAIGNEEIGTLHAFGIALSHGWRAKWQIAAFVMRVLWHLLLSLASVGVLYVFYYSHHTAIAYMHLSMMLCPKGDTK